MKDVKDINKILKHELNMRITHEDLVTAAKIWLQLTKGCNPVFSECGTVDERPDAIGWSAVGSIIVECKTNKNDFRSDAKKSVRLNPNTGMGRQRFCLFTRELYEQIKEDIPDGWGVLVLDYYRAARQVNNMGSKMWEHNKDAEISCLRNRIYKIQEFGKC